MTLIFGNFVQSFLGFGARLAEAKAGDATAQAQIPGAAAAFRHSAAKDATTLVYIGELTSRVRTNRRISFLIPLQALQCFFSLSHTCAYGCTLGRWAQSD
jgi:hypothetical protein